MLSTNVELLPITGQLLDFFIAKLLTLLIAVLEIAHRRNILKNDQKYRAPSSGPRRKHTGKKTLPRNYSHY